MIGGQVVDIESEGTPPTAELVELIHRAKTGALITTSIRQWRSACSTANSWRNSFWLRSRASRWKNVGLPRRPTSRSFSAKETSADGRTKDTMTRLSHLRREGWPRLSDRRRRPRHDLKLRRTWAKTCRQGHRHDQSYLGSPSIALKGPLRDAKELIADAFAASNHSAQLLDPLSPWAQYLVERKNSTTKTQEQQQQHPDKDLLLHFALPFLHPKSGQKRTPETPSHRFLQHLLPTEVQT